MLEVVGGQRPGRHNELLVSKEYRQELYREDLSVFDAHDAPRHYQHLRYLSDMLTEPGCPDSPAQVRCLSYHAFCLVICVNELDDAARENQFESRLVHANHVTGASSSSFMQNAAREKPW